MPRRARKPKPPPRCYHCGRELAWLEFGNDARHPVDPATLMVLRDARSIGNSTQALEGEVTGYDCHGYLMAGTRLEKAEVDRGAAAAGRQVPVYQYHECDADERAAFQAERRSAHPEPVHGGQDRAAGEA